MPDVSFAYFTGIGADIFDAATLVGSWNPEGVASETFSETPMRRGTGPDGCPSFRTHFSFPMSEIDKSFRWGVRLRRDGIDVWGITEEVNEMHSRENIRHFVLRAGNPPQSESYRLNWSRHLGAQKIFAEGESRPRMQFSVWAPNARNVEVVMGDLWQEGSNVSAIDPARTPALSPISAPAVSGGYISDSGVGAHRSWGSFAMRRDEAGIWRTETNDPAFADFEKFHHSPYMFRVTRDDDSVRHRTDLYSRCQIGFGGRKPDGEYRGLTNDLDGSVSCSVIKDPDVVCRDFSENVYPEQNWLDAGAFWAQEPESPRPSQLEDLVIYELHVGALGFGKAETEPGTLEDAIGFLDYLQELGVNAIELLPMAEFGGGGAGWGYATSHYFAIEYAGGGRDKYKHFIRECHKRGMAVILDVVFNHYSHDAERAEWLFDSPSHDRNIYYWYEGNPADYPAFNASVAPDRRGQGGYVDNMSTAWAPRYWEPMVRRMFISSLLAHVTEFQIDGFRFDQTTSIHAYNVLHADGTPVAAANAFGQKLLREATRALRLVKPNVLLMAEDHSNWPAVVMPPDEGGLGFGAVWYADYYHHLIGDTDKGQDYAKLLRTMGVGQDGALAVDYFAGALASSGQGRIVYHESHDEAGNARLTDRTINVAVNGAPLVGETRRVAEARVRVMTGITLFSAGTPLFLFGEEVGAMNKFLYGHVLETREDLAGLRRSVAPLLFDYYRAAIGLRLSPDRPALRSRNIEVVYSHNTNRVLAFRRWIDGQNLLVVASFNNQPYNEPFFAIESGRLGDESWREIFNSDSRMFGGNDTGNGGATLSSGPGRLNCTLPANGLIVFERV